MKIKQIFRIGRLTSQKIESWFALPISLAFFACLGVYPAQAAPASTAPIQPFAQVIRVDGELTAEGPNGTRVLRTGDSVMEGERVVAGAAVEGVLQARDAGLIAVRPGTEFKVVKFVADGKPTDTTHIALVRGALRIISGWIGKLNPGGSVLSTPTATVGIRGTDHEPFVLLADDEDATRYKPGTYDKVNQGGTTLVAAGQSVVIEPGTVGFARAPGKSRALLTLLFPVLLESVPGFYVPGKFDAEMDDWASKAAVNNAQQLQAKRQQTTSCVPGDIAKRWTDALDQHILRGDAAAILDMFAPDTQVKAAVRGANGEFTEVQLQGSELAESIVAAVAGLSNYKHRRIALEGKPIQAGSGVCGPIAVRSVVIEEGRQGGKPYRFESEEKYQLDQFDGVWRATSAQTRQR